MTVFPVSYTHLYGFNSGGVMRTGWLTDSKLDDNGDSDNSYYYCGEDGARALGWQWLEIPENWIDDSEDVTDYVHDNGQYAWFYFNQSTGKKRRSSGGKKETNVDGVTYCFDGNGIMYPGWVKLSSKTPEISGYRYFYQPTSETDKKFIAGQKVEGSWLYINGPADLDGSGQKEWYYFDNSGEPVHALSLIHILYMDAVRDDLGATVGNIINCSYKLMNQIKPDALLILGDTNSCLSAIAAKRLHIPIFHMEAGNRCKDECLPEETNRRIVDIISDVNLAYSEHARKYLHECGLPKERVYVTGSPMAEVLHQNLDEIKSSDILKKLGLEPRRYILLSLIHI